MNESEKLLIKALERVNLEYIELTESREYRLGKRVMQSIDGIKKLDIKTLYTMLRRKKAQMILNKKYPVKVSKNNRSESIWLEELIFDSRKLKVAIYTCIFGGYDEITDPILVKNRFDFFVFTENPVNSKIWKTLNIPSKLISLKDPILINRYIKLHPHEFFSGYDYSIYIDGNVTVVSDLSSLLKKADSDNGIAMHRHVLRDCIYDEAKACILYGKGNSNKLKEQIKKYEKERFPKYYGMLECTVIISNMKNKLAKKILNDWWTEFITSKSQRDQISLPYVLWKNNIEISSVGNLGENIYRNPKFRINPH